MKLKVFPPQKNLQFDPLPTIRHTIVTRNFDYYLLCSRYYQIFCLYGCKTLFVDRVFIMTSPESVTGIPNSFPGQHLQEKKHVSPNKTCKTLLKPKLT